MAKHDLSVEFRESRKRINLGEREKVAQAAHLEVRSVLLESSDLRAHGLDPVLIGSYARHTSIWPGKDVDIFGKLQFCDISSIDPAMAYGSFRLALARFGDRVVEQPRSLKVRFGPESGFPPRKFLEAVEARTLAIDAPENKNFEFSVDVVPAVRWGDRLNWAIPTRAVELWQAEPMKRWVKTNPEGLTELASRLNAAFEIGGQGAFVPTVKAVRQIKAHHLSGTRPSSLFYEFVLCEGFSGGMINGESWADVTHSALSYLADRMSGGAARPVQDPVLGEPYHPAPTTVELDAAALVLARLREEASEAVSADRCRAAYLWRSILGSNGHEGHDSVFPLPDGCRADGTALAAVTENPLRGGNRERGFGS